MVFTSGPEADKHVSNKAIDRHKSISELSFRRNFVTMPTPPQTSLPLVELFFQFTWIGYNQPFRCKYVMLSRENLSSTRSVF